MVNNSKREMLLGVVAQWLEEAPLPALVPRDHSGVEVDNLKSILAIVGPRRSGKTYFMYQLVQRLLEEKGFTKDDILFVDFEDVRLSGFRGEEIDELFTAFHQLAGKYPRFLFFDEIQSLPNWSRSLRTLHNRNRFNIVVSGSNSKLLSREVATELRGRYRDLLMLPFSFAEYLGFRGISFTEATLHTAARGRVLAAFSQFITHGGFPEVVMASTQSERRNLLQNYYRTIFYRDILERYNIKARHILEALMSELLETFSTVFSISRFEEALKGHGLPGSKRTIANYLHYLQEAFFIIVSEKFSFSPRKRAMNPKKVYLTDTGFAALGHAFSENRSRILENVVAIELFRRGLEFYYFKARNECDFVVKRGTKPSCALQVCWELNSRNQKRELAGLVEACNECGLSKGVIFTYDQEGWFEEKGVSVLVMPVWRWLLLNNVEELAGNW